MTLGTLGQHLLAGAIVLAAAAWLVRRAIRPKAPGGACAHCPAAARGRYAGAASASTGFSPKTSSKSPLLLSSASRSSARSSAPVTSIRSSSPET